MTDEVKAAIRVLLTALEDIGALDSEWEWFSEVDPDAYHERFHEALSIVRAALADEMSE